MILRELTDQVKIENIAGNQINPSSNEKLEELKTILDIIDANTDTLEDKTQSIRDQLDILMSTRASEITLQSTVNALGEGSGTNLLVELQTIITKFNILNTTDFATESTLIEIRDFVDTVEVKLQTIIDRMDVNLSTRASENTLGLVLTELESVEGKDFATETTLALIKTAIDAINTDLDVVLSTRASEATLDLIKGAIDAIDTDLDVALSTRSSETTLLLVKSNLDDVKTKLDTLNSTDFSTESTSTEIRDTIGQESGTTVLNKLQNIWDKLTSLFNNGMATVKLWDGEDILEITPSGRLQIDSSPPAPPPDTVRVSITEYGNVSGIDDYDYLIPNEEIINIQRFSAGAEPAGGSNIELWLDPDGTKLNMEIIDVIFSEGQSDQHDLNFQK